MLSGESAISPTPRGREPGPHRGETAPGSWGPPRVWWQAAARRPGSHSATQSAFPASVRPSEMQAGHALQTCGWSVGGSAVPEVANSLPLMGAPLEDGAGQGPVSRGGCGPVGGPEPCRHGAWVGAALPCALGVPTVVGTMLWPCSEGQVPRGCGRGASARTVRCPPGGAGTAALLQVPGHGATWVVGSSEAPGM